MNFLILYFYAMLILSKRYSNRIFSTGITLGMTSKVRAMPLAKGKNPFELDDELPKLKSHHAIKRSELV